MGGYQNRFQDNYQDQRLTVPQLKEAKRLDEFLAANLPLSKKRILKAIADGGVYTNKKRCHNPQQLLQGGEALRIVMLDNETVIPFTHEQIIWQQPPLYLIHKKSGQYAQEALHKSRGTLPDELGRYLQLPAKKAAQLRPVHRLDRDTSGLMMFCSDPKQLQHIQNLWHSHVFKSYLAVVSPAPDWESKRIKQPISRQRDRLGRYCVDSRGRASDTEAEVIVRREDKALLRLIPHTGRTHQLRVHLSHLGCPIIGDHRYGGKKHSRLMLHAQSLCVQVPALKQTHEWKIDPEEDWQW